MSETFNIKKAPVDIDVVGSPEVAELRSPASEAWMMFVRNKAAVLGLIILFLINVVSLLGPIFFPVDPFDLVWMPFTSLGESEYLLGTDYLGRDVFAGVIHGGQATLTVGYTAAIISVLIGVTVGALAGFYGGRVERILMWVTEFFQVLPALLLAMVLVTLFTPSLTVIAFSIGVVSWTPMARLTRAEFMRVKELEYVKAARSVGASNIRIILRVILPNTMPPLIVMTALNIGVAILFEAGLSFLGLGDPSEMSWGMMIGSSREYVLDAWWPVTFPGIAIFLTVLGISLVGDGLNDAFNTKLRER